MKVLVVSQRTNYANVIIGVTTREGLDQFIKNLVDEHHNNGHQIHSVTHSLHNFEIEIAARGEVQTISFTITGYDVE